MAYFFCVYIILGESRIFMIRCVTLQCDTIDIKNHIALLSPNEQLQSKKTLFKSMENIYTQAVLDAKAVRASAIANAKATIQESFEPKIKAMLKKHITESEEEMDEAEHIVHTNKKHRAGEAGYKMSKAPHGAIEDMEEGHYEDEMDEMYHDDEMDEHYMDESEEDEMEEGHHEEDEMDESYLDEILGELEEMDESEEELEEGEEDEMDEAKHHMEEAKKKHKHKEEELDETKHHMDEAEEGDEEEESEEDEDGEDEEGETKVVDMTLGDLVDAIKAAMAGHEGGEEGMEGGDDEVSLDEILAELEEEEEDELEESEEMDEAKHHHKHKGMEEAKKKFPKDKEGIKKDKEYVVKTHGAATKAAGKDAGYKPVKVKTEAKELEEAKKAIAAMRKELNEINLLNAKLLYVNKIFKSKSLTESQKVKVLNAFDKATTVKEVKTVFYAINESVAAPKKQLKESFSGFASKPAGFIKKANTVDSDPFITRMQKLAGL